MKYLKYLLGVLLLLVILFFGKGLLTPSIAYENSIIVEKTAAESWAVMSDQSKMSQWIDGFIRTELVSGTESTVGAVSHIYVEDQGEEMMMEETITEIKENEVMAMAFKIDFMDMDYKMVMDEANGKTTITTNTVTRGNGLFAKSLISFMKGGMTSQEDTNLTSLKNLIESNTTNYFQADPVVE